MHRNHLEFPLASTATSLEPSELKPKAASPLLYVWTGRIVLFQIISVFHYVRIL